MKDLEYRKRLANSMRCPDFFFTMMDFLKSRVYCTCNLQSTCFVGLCYEEKHCSLSSVASSHKNFYPLVCVCEQMSISDTINKTKKNIAAYICNMTLLP